MVGIAACGSDGRELRPPRPDQNESIAIAPESTEATAPLGIAVDWQEGGAIDARHTCAGEGISPAIEFIDVAPDLVSLGVTLVEIDASGAADAAGLTWIVANIDVAEPYLLEGDTPEGVAVGQLADGTVGYRAPCPPAGETRTYLLSAYGLPQFLEFDTGTPAATLLEALEGAALEATSTTFTVTGT